MITALGGGVGAAKFLEGLSALISDEQLTVIVNTADDITYCGLRISPDIDTIIYRLSGIVDKKKGWGIEGDSFSCLGALGSLGMETWFNVGDRDFATHLFRTDMRIKGRTASEITSELSIRYGIPENIKVVPMTDTDVETWIVTTEGEMHFQEYLVRRKMTPEVTKVIIRNIENAEPSPELLGSIKESRAVILCPSNPIISIGPILQVRGVKKALVNSNAKIIAISPLIGGVPLKGPADRLMRGVGLEVSSTQVARLYRDFLDMMIIDFHDAHELDEIRALGIESVALDTLMSDSGKAAALARNLLDLL